jgi:hypothetical protein
MTLYEVAIVVTVEAENAEKALEKAGIDLKGENLVEVTVSATAKDY